VDEQIVRRGSRSVRLTHLERVLWPEAGIRRRDLFSYYESVARVVIPHLRNRPFTMKRHYTVPRGPFEWVKDAPPELPEWVATCPQPARSRRGALVRYPLVNDPLALLWMIEFGCIDLHAWTARCDRPDRPDHVVLDLDPRDGAAFPDAIEAAQLAREALAALGLESLPRTSGSGGVHVLVPIARRHTYPEVREFAAVVAHALARAEPSLERHVNVDVKMNGHGQQFVVVYSVRPLPGAPVCTPLLWDELTRDLDYTELTMDVVSERVAELGDVHEPLLHGRQRLDAALARLA
jgi:bifunctional non-homologous end joining protein LigD